MKECKLERMNGRKASTRRPRQVKGELRNRMDGNFLESFWFHKNHQINNVFPSRESSGSLPAPDASFVALVGWLTGGDCVREISFDRISCSFSGE